MHRYTFGVQRFFIVTKAYLSLRGTLPACVIYKWYGCGISEPNTRINTFFGYCWETDWTQDLCWEERTCSWILIHVFYVQRILRKTFSIYSSNVPFHVPAGLSWTYIGTLLWTSKLCCCVLESIFGSVIFREVIIIALWLLGAGPPCIQVYSLNTYYFYSTKWVYVFNKWIYVFNKMSICIQQNNICIQQNEHSSNRNGPNRWNSPTNCPVFHTPQQMSFGCLLFVFFIHSICCPLDINYYDVGIKYIMLWI